MNRARLTYCGNVHPVEDLDAWCGAIERYAAPVAVQSGCRGLGVWWNARCAAELAGDAGARQRVRDLLQRHDLEILTCNVFPYGEFHAERVKTAVYRPDWADTRRLRFTLDVAAVVTELAAAGKEVPLSTLPLGYGDGDRPRMVAHLRELAREFDRLARATGVHCVLALEPEPNCLLETAAATATFLEDEVFAGAAVPEATLRRHLGVCVDLCHLFVVGEEPISALLDLAARAITVPKVQVSSCLELRDPAGALDQLLEFDEARYLHQTSGGPGLRVLDLSEIRTRRAEFAAAERLRTHFHVPIFWDREGVLGSSRNDVDRVLRALPRPYPLLEVETYTWDVLDPTAFGAGDLVAGLCAELAYVRDVLE